MKKRLVILDLIGGGRLGNQLWNMAGLYAYCLERGYTLENYTFFDYARFFNIPQPENLFVRFFFYTLNRIKLYRKLNVYEKILSPLRKLLKDKIIEEDRINPFYLPPAISTNPEQIELIRKIETEKNKTVYMSGWLFRNPVGIEKYRKEITSFLRPKEKIMHKLKNEISTLRNKYRTVVGVHIRQTDYRIRRDGQPFPFYFTPEEARKILDDYLINSRNKSEETVFVICSDEELNPQIFNGLNVFFPKGGTVEDMFILTLTDIIIGNDSTFGSFASYFGNLPMVVFERPAIDWSFYRGKNKYFENKKHTLTWY